MTCSAFNKMGASSTVTPGALVPIPVGRGSRSGGGLRAEQACRRVMQAQSAPVKAGDEKASAAPRKAVLCAKHPGTTILPTGIGT
jgi:hypothetical protein